VAAGQDTKKAEHGIIFLDEFDKLARKSGANLSITSDPSRESVQQALLKIIEGSVVNFNPSSTRRNPDQPGIYMDTSNILFVVGGAFEGIEKIIDKRISTEGGFGFGSNDELGLDNLDDEIERHNKLIDNITTEDFTKFGIIPELLGRTPIICKMHNLTTEEMVRILTEPKNAIIKQYQTMFVMDRCKLKFSKEALEAVAEKAIKTKTGARALRTIVENILLDTMYDLPDKCRNAQNMQSTVTITKENVNGEPVEIVQSPQAA
jgi:ATP-dependent Clp protease ATP-binding subunit ClpX